MANSFKIPKSQKLIVKYYSCDGANTHVVACTHDETKYFLYKVEGEEVVKIESGQSPVFKDQLFNSIYNKDWE